MSYDYEDEKNLPTSQYVLLNANNICNLSNLRAEVFLPSFQKQWGTKKKTGQGYKPVRQLRFSKSGNSEIEKAYATHYVDGQRIAEIKAEQASHVGNEESNLDFRQRKM